MNEYLNSIFSQNASPIDASERFELKVNRIYFCVSGRTDIFLYKCNQEHEILESLTYICSVDEQQIFYLYEIPTDYTLLARCIHQSVISFIDENAEHYAEIINPYNYLDLKLSWLHQLIKNFKTEYYHLIKQEISAKGDSPELHHQIIKTLIQNHEEKISESSLKLQQSALNDEYKYQKASDHLTHIFQKKKITEIDTNHLYSSAIYKACQILCSKLKINIKAIDEAELIQTRDQIQYIAKVSGFKYRQFELSENWWEKDCGSFLAYNQQDEIGVITSLENNHYRWFNCEKESEFLIDVHNKDEIKNEGIYFYKAFPEKSLNLWGILTFSAESLTLNNITPIILLGFISGILNAFIPVLTGIVIEQQIPSRNYLQFYQILLLFASIGISAILFNTIKSIAIGKVEFKIDNILQSALWSRLVDLPVSFFRRFSSGEIGKKVLSFYQIKVILSSILIDSFLSLIFSVSYFFVLFSYSVKIASFALLLSLFTFSLSIVFGIYQVRAGFQRLILTDKLSGLMSELISGIGKIRLSGTFKRAFCKWGDLYGQQKTQEIRYQKLQVINNSLMSLISIVSSIIIFSLSYSEAELSIGQFIAFNSAFIAFQMTLMSLSGTSISISYIYAILQNVKPILEEIPEALIEKAEAHSIKGDIEFSNVNFKYEQSEDLVIKDFSLKINDGDYVAIVGSSGSGKSTLFRLLLGFEQAMSGKIYISEKDLEQYDIASIRKHMGVVLQNSQLIAGDIFSNIIGNSTDLTEKEVWEACEMAEIKEDIEAMPMKLWTYIDEKSSTISGGQKQRILIAKALIQKPSILLLDEATSALDNLTQKNFTSSLKKLKCTRVVIAHRLSTVVDCDQIVVLDKGRMVEQGTYQELINQKSFFYQLVQRQML